MGRRSREPAWVGKGQGSAHPKGLGLCPSPLQGALPACLWGHGDSPQGTSVLQQPQPHGGLWRPEVSCPAPLVLGRRVARRGLGRRWHLYL